MQAIALFLRKLRILLGRDRFNRDLDEEMAFHREQAQQKLQSYGLPDRNRAARRAPAIRQ